MSAPAKFLNASEVAKRLGVSVKALKLYELRGLVTPIRTSAGWRAYGAEDLARAGEVAALRKLGLSLAQVAEVLGGDAKSLDLALAEHQRRLESRIHLLAGAIARVQAIRSDLARSKMPGTGELGQIFSAGGNLKVAFELPWPWGGEWFEISDIRPLNYITGPLGCGKTRLALRLAESIRGAAFLDLERGMDGGVHARARVARDASLQARVDASLTWFLEEGATMSDSLYTLIVGLEEEEPTAFVVDMVEQGLDHTTQSALISRLRRRGLEARPLFLMTRSSVILDMTEVSADEAIIYCPANHARPIFVAPYFGSFGYEAVVTCLASPQIRARTEGMRAKMPDLT